MVFIGLATARVIPKAIFYAAIYVIDPNIPVSDARGEDSCSLWQKVTSISDQSGYTAATKMNTNRKSPD